MIPNYVGVPGELRGLGREGGDGRGVGLAQELAGDEAAAGALCGGACPPVHAALHLGHHFHESPCWL